MGYSYNKDLDYEYNQRLGIVRKLKDIEINGDCKYRDNIFTEKEIYNKALNFIDNRIKLLLERKEKAKLKKKEIYKFKKNEKKSL